MNDLIPVTDVILGEQFTAAEAEILKGLLSDEDSAVELAIPENIEPDKLWSALDCACKMRRTIKKAGDRIKPVIGRLLIVLQDFPQLYQAKGYRTYDDFMTRGMDELFGIDRGEAYKLSQAAKLLPGLSIARFRDIGVAKIYTILPAVRENPAAKDRLLHAAETMTVEKLKSHVATLRHQTPEDIHCDSIVIFCNKTLKEQWLHFKKNSAIQSYVGSERDAEIFSCMLAECQSDWFAALDEQARAV